MVLLLVASSTTVVLAEGGNRALMEQLRAGGVVIYFRHGITETTQSDHQPLNLEDCAAQRNLSQAGREQMRAIGQAMNALQIPRGAVIEEGGETAVFVIAGDTVEKRAIRTGYSESGYIEVLEGLDEKDEVVIVGQSNLKNGSKVAVINSSNTADMKASNDRYSPRA